MTAVPDAARRETARGARRRAWLLVAAALAGIASGQSAWTVQTVALRDLREAEREVAHLRSIGLPAFTEFTMANGLQWVRVRVGCHGDRDGAEAWAAVIRSAVAPDAAAVPVDGPPPLDVPCVTSEIGFRKPTTWSLVSGPGEVPTFRVEVFDHVAYLRHDGGTWRLWQSVAPEPLPLPAVTADQRVRVGHVGGAAIVQSNATALCPGTLLGAAGAVAIVERADAVVACWLDAAAP